MKGEVINPLPWRGGCNGKPRQTGQLHGGTLRGTSDEIAELRGQGDTQLIAAARVESEFLEKLPAL